MLTWAQDCGRIDDHEPGNLIDSAFYYLPMESPDVPCMIGRHPEWGLPILSTVQSLAPKYLRE